MLKLSFVKEHIDFGVTDCGVIRMAKSVKGFLFTDDTKLLSLAKKFNILSHTPQTLMDPHSGTK